MGAKVSPLKAPPMRMVRTFMYGALLGVARSAQDLENAWIEFAKKQDAKSIKDLIRSQVAVCDSLEILREIDAYEKCRKSRKRKRP